MQRNQDFISKRPYTIKTNIMYFITKLYSILNKKKCEM